MTILINALIMALELAGIAAATWLGYHHPVLFACLTAMLALCLGVALEIARLKNEMPFYFDREPGRVAIFSAIVGSVEAFVKAILAGVVALLTFLGTDPERLYSVALIFAGVLFIGCNAVNWLAYQFKARPLRWGYFRLAAPLGLLYSIGLSFLPSPGLYELAKRATFELPDKPSMEQASEFLFLLKQSFDDIVERLLGIVFDENTAQALGAIVSVNMLSGFVLALFAVVIAETARLFERRA
jgi:hypothetical protein